MADETKAQWLNYLSASTVIIAVCATLSTFKGGGYSTRSLLSQSKASDQWAYYQSKSIKSYIYEMQKDNLELQLTTASSDANKEEIQKRIDFYKQKTDKYTEEKELISKDAKEFEGVRDESKKHSEAFGIAVIFLQISILLSSIAALTKKKIVWYIGIAIGIIGILHFINGFVLFF